MTNSNFEKSVMT